MGTFLGKLTQQQPSDLFLSISGSPFPTRDSQNDDLGIIGKISLEYFITAKTSFSGSFFMSNNTLLNNDSRTNINSYGFIPSIQYYFVVKLKVKVFGQVGYGIGFEDHTRNFGNIENSALTIFSIGAGLNYRIKEHLFLQLALPYFTAKNITINQYAADGIGAFLGFNFKL